jgi:hypothetical protein
MITPQLVRGVTAIAAILAYRRRTTEPGAVTRTLTTLAIAFVVVKALQWAAAHASPGAAVLALQLTAATVCVPLWAGLVAFELRDVRGREWIPNAASGGPLGDPRRRRHRDSRDRDGTSRSTGRSGCRARSLRALDHRRHRDPNAAGPPEPRSPGNPGRGLPLPDLAQAIVTQLRAFEAGRPASDDVTLLLARRVEQPKQAQPKPLAHPSGLG